MGLRKNIAELGNNLKDVIHSIVDPKQMREIAKATGFVQRFSSRLKGDEFIQAMIIESVNGDRNSLRGSVDTIGEIKPNACMSIQGLGQRINTQGAVTFIQKIFFKAFDVIVNQLADILKIPQMNADILRHFTNVYLQDSTESLLDEELKDTFKGSGGGSGNGIGEASTKIDLIFECKRKIISHLKVTDRREPDCVLGEHILKVIKKGDLVIRDLGYSFIDGFKRIQEIGAYFLSRLHASLNVYLSTSDTRPLLLGNFLTKNVGKSGIVDTMVYISKQMFHCRLIAYKVPLEIEKSRRREYLKECKKKNRGVNKDHLKRLSFTIFITNVPVSIWSANIVGTVYRLRWQIELIFKSWKSNLKFDYFEGTSPFRITCLIYSRLTAILILFTIYACADKVAIEALEKEISIHKIIDWLTKNGRYFDLVIKGFSKDLWEKIVEVSNRLLCKEKRNGKATTWEMIRLAIPFGCATC